MQSEVENNKFDELNYPFSTMFICLLLIGISPFTTLLLNYAVFGLCIYRVVRYDIEVFAVDYCILACVSYIFLSTGQVSLLAWLSILAAAWYIVKYGIYVNDAFVLLVILMDYLLLRMQTAANYFVLCFSQILLLYVLFSQQKRIKTTLCTQAFCYGVVLSSIYAMFTRNTIQIRSLLGDETVAYWGSSLKRFQGLFRDPNYYMTMVSIALVLFVVLFINHQISKGIFGLGSSLLMIFGALTYSKTFVVMLAILAIILVCFLFYRKQYILGIVSIAGGVILIKVLSNTLLSVIVYRITSTDNLYDLTTGRSYLIIKYFKEITKSISIFFFGEGLSANILERGTHNLFLEIMFYLGAVGLFLFVIYFILCVKMVKNNSYIYNSRLRGPFRYIALIIFVVLFNSLQGLFFTITYVMLYLAIASAFFESD